MIRFFLLFSVTGHFGLRLWT